MGAGEGNSQVFFFFFFAFLFCCCILQGLIHRVCTILLYLFILNGQSSFPVLQIEFLT